MFEDHLLTTTPLGKQGVTGDPTKGVLPWCKWKAAEGDDADQPDGQNYNAVSKIIGQAHDKPFFIALGLHKPHDPFFAPAKYFDLYPVDQIKLAQQPADRTPDQWPAIPNQSEFKTFLAMSEAERRGLKRSYLACESFMDAQVGKLFKQMDDQKLWDNTIVIFTGDNGYHLGEHDWWNKVTLYERGVRVPFIMWVPGQKGMGQTTSGITELLDLYPTLIDLCQLPAQSGLEGQSFRGLLEDPSAEGKPCAFSVVRRGEMSKTGFFGRSVRMGHWRYTEWDGGKQGSELYDLTQDPQNYYNVVQRPEYAQTVSELKERLHSQKMLSTREPNPALTPAQARAEWKSVLQD